MYKYIFWLISIIFISCEQNIDLNLPVTTPKVVVDGYVESGLPPYILLSRSSGYFDPINSTELVNDAVNAADVWISDGIDTVKLTEIVVSGSSLKGVYAAIDSATSLPLMIGIPGRIYTLTIQTKEGEQLSATAKLEAAIPLDSAWFKLNEGNDSLGLSYGRLNDPDTLGNCYRWMSKRIGKDDLFLAPLGSTFEDRFINGIRFDFPYNRGKIQNSDAIDDNNEEASLFKLGDTIVVKFTTVDRAVFEFWRDAETQLSNNGSPFAVPSNIKSNILGGLGLFATYSPSYDTIIAQ